MTIVFGSQPEVISTQLLLFVAADGRGVFERVSRRTVVRQACRCCVAHCARRNERLAGVSSGAGSWRFISLSRADGEMGLDDWIRVFHRRDVRAAVQAGRRGHARLAMDDATGSRRTASNVADNNESITLAQMDRGEALAALAIGRHTLAGNRADDGLDRPCLIAKAAACSSPSKPLIALLLCWTACTYLVGRQGVFVHEWWWWPLSAGAAMSCGRGS